MPKIILDLETTGFSTEKHSIWEIAALKVGDNKEIELFHTRLNPLTEFHPKALEITDIHPSDLWGCPIFNDIKEGLWSFIGKSDIIAYNAHFDFRFLKHADKRYSKNHVYDYLKVTRKLLPGIHNHQLPTVCEALGISLDHHKASSDVEALWGIINKLGWPDGSHKIN